MTESVGRTPTFAGTAAQASFGVTDVLLFIMAVIWGVNFVVVKYATHIFSPVAFTGLRVGVAALFLVSVAVARGGLSLPRADVLRLLLLGSLGNGLYQLFFVHGVARTRAGNAALIIGAVPAFVAVMARFRGMERVKRTTLVGIALSVLGVALVIIGSAGSSRGGNTVLGAVLVFLGALCWSWYTILLQPYTTRVDVVQLTAVTAIGGAIPLIIASTPALLDTDWSKVGAGGWSALIYSSALSMGIAYFFWYRGLRVLGPTRTAVYANLQPIVALLVAWPFLGEVPTIFQWVGAATIVAGVFLTRS
jgi:drug/metabolite transporter (DMT)-like permease